MCPSDLPTPTVSVITDHRQRWNRVADPIHGLIQFDRQNPSHQIVLSVMGTQAFQRLRRIKQMGLAEFVFPGATHSRFIHSLGATHLMMRALAQLTRIGCLSEDAMYEGLPVETLALLGILLHDIGHPPLSHTLEVVLDLGRHGALHDSYWNQRLLREDDELVAVWRSLHPQLPDSLSRFLGENDTRTRHPLALLISSQLDMDRLDYLQRDSHFLGVQYGRVECDRLLMNLEFATDPDGQMVVALREEALPAAEHYLFSRHQAYKMASHALDKASESLLRLACRRFERSIRSGRLPLGRGASLYQLMTDPHSLDITAYLYLDDGSLWALFQDWSRQNDDPVLQQLALRLLRHDLLKYVDLTKLGLLSPLSQYPRPWQRLQAAYRALGLAMEDGFDEVQLRLKPVYKTDREPIWIMTARGLADIADVSSLSLNGPAHRDEKHLVFVWNRELRDQLYQDLLGEHAE